jgi:hypothetical protein
VRPFTEAVASHGRIAGRTRVWVDLRLHKPPEPRPDFGLVFVGGTPPTHGHGLTLPADPEAFDAQVSGLFAYLRVDDNPIVRTALRSVPRDAPSAEAETDDLARQTIRALDADEHIGSVDLAAARAHQNPRVRAAATRWLVRRGLEPEAAELLCGTRLILWHGLGPPA